MSTNIKTIIGITFASILVLTVSCKGKEEENKEPSTEATMEHDMDSHRGDTDHKSNDMEQMDTAEMQGKEYTSKYVCPMHCEGSGSETEGKCPVCGMTYVLNEDHVKDGHMHE